MRAWQLVLDAQLECRESTASRPRHQFTAYAERSDLIFLQEAVPLKTETVIAQSLYEAFVRYVQDEIDTGVLTLAPPHLVHRHLLVTEPGCAPLRRPALPSTTGR